ncbi:hypothetical protein Hypma_014329 [Hypsizygus marmoreus]|uniref:Uncharacterized protein n=1 Tax=Hypsizygus marmoreus TaxID=39966 RepID=A0A369JAW3_HYPMA|nr:hypothetical protein Hypma_014329 [Hypsizygus marmoreus]
MKFALSIVPLAAIFFTTSLAAPVKRDVDPALVPEFGHPAGLNPTGTGDCDGITNAAGQVVKIPCACPPDRNSFLKSLNANVNAGRAVNNPSVAVSFPTDNSKASQLTRMQAAIVTLQNLNGSGKGCPAASTTFLAQQKAIQDGTASPPTVPSPPTAPAPAPAPAPSVPAPSAGGVDPALVPEFGHPSGLNPTGTGDCDGITNAAGQVVKIPCACPPDRNAFIQSLSANVAAGKAINNPSVAVSFPTDDSKASQLTRMQAAIVTLQNLNGPGKGCPAASTTFLAQQKAIQDETAPAPAPVPAQPSPEPAPAAGGVDPALVPDLGHPSGLNPTGTGDCDGITNDAGKVVKVPCSCPPDRATFINALNVNVAAGRAVNNPSVSVSFPTDNSNASKAARIVASLVTLQNLNGPGVGCPAASTTLSAQLKAVQ